MKNKRIIFVIGIVIVLIVLCCLVFQNMNERFTKQRWLFYPDIRYKMIDDIEKNNSIIGKNQQEVQELLGEPDSKWEHDFEDGHYNYYQYYIGKKHGFYEIMWEPDMYLITFRNGLVIATSVQST